MSALTSGATLPAGPATARARASLPAPQSTSVGRAAEAAASAVAGTTRHTGRKNASRPSSSPTAVDARCEARVVPDGRERKPSRRSRTRPASSLITRSKQPSLEPSTAGSAARKRTQAWRASATGPCATARSSEAGSGGSPSGAASESAAMLCSAASIRKGTASAPPPGTRSASNSSRAGERRSPATHRKAGPWAMSSAARRA